MTMQMVTRLLELELFREKLESNLSVTWHRLGLSGSTFSKQVPEPPTSGRSHQDHLNEKQTEEEKWTSVKSKASIFQSVCASSKIFTTELFRHCTQWGHFVHIQTVTHHVVLTEHWWDPDASSGRVC